MKVFIAAKVEQQKEMQLKNTAEDISLIFATDCEHLDEPISFDAIFLLDENLTIDLDRFSSTPLFVNSVVDTLAEKNYAPNVSRINGWPGFLKRTTWEVATRDLETTAKIFERLGWGFAVVNDVPGLVSARVIAMIVNEAYFALGEGISSEEEINLAMKLGTNYPMGPFEWANKIGICPIYQLLTHLSEKNTRYRVAPLLEQQSRERATYLS